MNWYEEFYRVESTHTLFGDTDRIVEATTATIGRYFDQRLRSHICRRCEGSQGFEELDELPTIPPVLCCR
jgi:hypothetical protein